MVAVGLAAGADGPDFAHLHAAVHFLCVVDFAVYGFDAAAVERGGFGGAHDFEHVVAQDVVAAEGGAFAAEGLVAEAGAGGKGEGGEEGEEFAHGDSLNSAKMGREAKCRQLYGNLFCFSGSLSSYFYLGRGYLKP